MRKSILKFASGSIAVLALLAATAHARNFPGYGGKAWIGSEVTCFSDNHGGAVQNCTGSRYWFTPLVIDSTNVYYAPSVNVTGNGNGVACANWAVSEDLGIVHSTAMTSTYYGASATRIYPGSVQVPTNGHLFSWCYAGQGTSINNLAW